MVTWSLAARGWPRPDGEKRSGIPEGHFRLKHKLAGREGAKMLISLPLGPILASPSTVTPAARVSGPPALRTTSWDAPWKSTWTLSGTVSLFSCLGGGFDLQEADVCLSARPRKTSGFPDLWKHWNLTKGSEVTPTKIPTTGALKMLHPSKTSAPLATEARRFDSTSGNVIPAAILSCL